MVAKSCCTCDLCFKILAESKFFTRRFLGFTRNARQSNDSEARG